MGNNTYPVRPMDVRNEVEFFQVIAVAVANEDEDALVQLQHNCEQWMETEELKEARLSLLESLVNSLY